MTLAYVIVLVNDELIKHYTRETVQEAQEAADSQFEKLAQAELKTLYFTAGIR